MIIVMSKTFPFKSCWRCRWICLSRTWNILLRYSWISML